MIKNIFITGTSGFIGQHVLKEFSGKDFCVYALSRQDVQHKIENIRYVKGNLFEISKFSETLSTIDYFIHIAGEKRNENRMRDVNVKGLSVLLLEIVKYPNIKFLQVSSAGVYGIESHHEKVLTENSDSYPNNAYERTKYEAERLLIDYKFKTGLTYSVVRPTNVFGENDRGLKLLNLFKSLKNDHFYFINPNAVVNYVYVKQVTYVIRQLIRNDIFQNKIYNVNAPCEISEFISIIKKAMGLNSKTKRIPSPLVFAIKIIGKISDRLPSKCQYINSGKYRELTSEKYYSTEEIRKIMPINEREMLSAGIHNLVIHYKEKGLL